jgi:hypothetical protein
MELGSTTEKRDAKYSAALLSYLQIWGRKGSVFPSGEKVVRKMPAFLIPGP